MKQFFRDNPTLVFGLGLPLVLVLAFSLASVLPNLGSPPPRYSVLYSRGPDNSTGLQVRVANKKAVVEYIGTNNHLRSAHRIYLFNPVDDSVREIPVTLPPEIILKNHFPASEAKPALFVTPIHVPELETLTLDGDPVSPDGYRFESEHYERNAGLLVNLLLPNRYRNEIVLKKGSYKVPLPESENSFGTAQFIGWIITQ